MGPRVKGADPLNTSRSQIAAGSEALPRLPFSKACAPVGAVRTQEVSNRSIMQKGLRVFFSDEGFSSVIELYEEGKLAAARTLFIHAAEAGSRCLVYPRGAPWALAPAEG